MEHRILSLRQQAAIRDKWLEYRLKYVLPQIMRREGFDMWIVIAREYNEDPVIMSLLPAKMLSARRRTILVFCLQEDGHVEALNVGRYGLGKNLSYKSVWDKDKEDQWTALRRVVDELNPRCIGVNYASNFAFGDGLSHSEYLQLVEVLGPEHTGRIRSAERLAVGWLECRTQAEIDAYPGIVRIAHSVIAKGFSRAVIHPGITTALDVAWWIRQEINNIGLTAWFQPTVDIQRRGCESVGDDEVILPGDLLHCDVGLHYLGLATDTQHNAYVLKPHEVDAPDGLKVALYTGNCLQDIFAAEFVVHRTGNEILAQSLEEARNTGIKASIYTHPLGYHGHGAGPTIGLWDQQDGVPGKGDYELFNNTCYAMELNIKQAVPEWDNQQIRMALEEDIVFTGNRVYYLAERQKKLYLV